VTAVEEVDDEGVAEALPLDWVEPELTLVLVDELWLVAAPLLVAPVAMTVTRPLNATPDTTAVTHRARAAGWRRRGPGRPAVGGRRRGSSAGWDSLGGRLIGVPRVADRAPEDGTARQEAIQADPRSR